MSDSELAERVRAAQMLATARKFEKHAELLCEDYDKRDRDGTTITLDEERLFLAICYLSEAADVARSALVNRKE